MNIIPYYLSYTNPNKQLIAGDILTLDLDFKMFNKENQTVKINILKKTTVKDTMLMLYNHDKEDIPQDINTRAILLGYENCHHYNKDNIKFVLCIEKI